MSLFSIATAQTHFLLKGPFYDQIDGVAMGSPLVPVLSNLFMGHHEKSWLENFQDSEILFYRRYVDDTFFLFHSEHEALLLFNYINSRHPNIRFTMEKEIDHKIPFLDVLINNETHFPVTSVYRKKTFTGLLTYYFSFTSHSYKLGLVRTLVDRAYKINNTWLGFHEDITKLTKILQKNLFPVPLVQNIINHYSHLLAKIVIPRLPSLTLHVPFTSNYLTLVLSLVSHRKKFATLLNAIVTTLILS